ncbi:MAG: CDGSH iron-sulfur domain-containing protein [Planctomycetota bacterium]
MSEKAGNRAERLAPGDPPGRPQSQPFVVDCPPGKYAYCQCKHSSRYPYCDGSHVGSDLRPIKVIFEEARRVAWCACGQSGDKPFCDGSHAGSQSGSGDDSPRRGLSGS